MLIYWAYNSLPSPGHLSEVPTLQTWEEMVRVWENLGYEFLKNTTVGCFDYSSASVNSGTGDACSGVQGGVQGRCYSVGEVDGNSLSIQGAGVSFEAGNILNRDTRNDFEQGMH